MLLSALLFLSSEGCGRSVPPPRVACGTCEETHRFVRVQHHVLSPSRDGASGFDHPFVLDQQKWRTILKTVQVQRLGTTFLLFPMAEEAVASAFTPEEIEFLSTTLPRAFTEAQKDDWVVFSLGRPQPNNLTMVTTGAWYVEEPLLYFVLANYDAGVSMPIIRDELDRDPLYDIAGSPPFKLIPSDFVEKVTAHKSLMGYFKSKPPTLAIEYKRLLDKPGSSSTDVQDKVDSSPRIQEPGDSPLPLSIEERLEKLRQLKKKGLITEEDFERKKKEWLDQM